MRPLTSFALGCAIFLVGCADSSGGSSGGVGIIGNLESASWLSPCFSNSTAYVKSTASIVNGNYNVSFFYYSDSSCTSLYATVEESRTYVATAMNATGDGTVDWTLGNLTRTPNTVAEANSYNTATACGYSDWAANVPKSILGITCGSTTYASAGAIRYDIYRIIQLSEDPLSAGDLKFGMSSSGHNGSSSSQRFITLDSAHFYEN